MEKTIAFEVGQVAQEDAHLFGHDRVYRRNVIGVKMVVEKCAVLSPLQPVRHCRDKPIKPHAVGAV